LQSDDAVNARKILADNPEVKTDPGYGRVKVPTSADSAAP
jgi:hypothetical protein